MKAEHTEAFEKLFSYIYRGDKAAQDISFILLNFFHIWDDIKDQDKELLQQQVDYTFFDLLTRVAGCPLWDAHLQGCFMSVYYRWQAANEIEKLNHSTIDLLNKAWMLRAGLYDIFVMLAAKLHGQQWAESIAVTVYETYGESLETYLKEAGHA